MRKLELKENVQVFGGEPSERRCQRLLRRAQRYLDNDNFNGFDRVIALYDDIC